MACVLDARTRSWLIRCVPYVMRPFCPLLSLLPPHDGIGKIRRKNGSYPVAIPVPFTLSVRGNMACFSSTLIISLAFIWRGGGTGLGSCNFDVLSFPLVGFGSLLKHWWRKPSDLFICNAGAFFVPFLPPPFPSVSFCRRAKGQPLLDKASEHISLSLIPFFVGISF